jgi:isochorismate synthase
VVFAHGGVELLGLGEMREMSLGSLADVHACGEQPSALVAPEIVGDPGPRGSLPRIHFAVPFEQGVEIKGFLPSIQVTTTQEGSWLTTIGKSLDEAERASLEFERFVSSVDEVEVACPGLQDLTEEPSREGYAGMVRAAVSRISQGDLEKVVLSRAVTVRADQNLDVASILDRMAEREPSCTTFVIPTRSGVFVGASPEVLIQRRGRHISSHPLAGTISLREASRERLLADSPKDLEEHRLVVVDIAQRLTPLVESIDVPSAPSIVSLRSVAHLGSSITATLSDSATTDALGLLAAIHPTPAIGGTPRPLALELIRELELEPREAFGGAVGWMASDGDGEFVLGIRGAVVDGASALVRAGAGIVAASTPEGETEETKVKLASILDAVIPGSSRSLSRDEALSER